MLAMRAYSLPLTLFSDAPPRGVAQPPGGLAAFPRVQIAANGALGAFGVRFAID